MPERTKTFLLFTLGLIFATPAKNAAHDLPRFEVATIKPVEPNAFHMMGVEVYPGGRVVIKAFTLKDLICTAFNLSYWQLSGGNRWTDKIQYTVNALPPEDVRSSMPDTRHTNFGIEDEHLRRMLQALLIDRFQLRFHRETKTDKVYLLETNGKHVRLHPTNAGSAGSIGFAGNWVLSNTTMLQLAKFAADHILHSPVLDRTGLTGAFDYKAPPEDWGAYSNDMTGSFLNLIREIGLRFKPSKGPVEAFVIDRADKPSPN